MDSAATTAKEGLVNSTVEVRADALVVNVKERDRSAMFVPTLRIPLGHVVGAEADPEIERKLERAWVLRDCKPGTYSAPHPELRFYTPRHYCAHKAIVIRLRDETCERLVVEVEDPEGVVKRVNRAVGAIAPALSVV